MNHRTIATAITATAIAFGLLAAPPAHADPACNAPGMPPCAPPPDPNLMCAAIAFRLMMPCNWVGVQVPQGTPGSWG